MDKIWKLRPFDPQLTVANREVYHSPLFAQLLSQRNITPEQSRDFFEARFETLKNARLTGIDKAAALIMEAARSQSPVAVIGDYDVDGVTSATILHGIFEALYLTPRIFLPSRLRHGYGLNEKTVAEFLKTCDGKMPDLLVVADCGTSSEPYIQQLKSAGIKHIVIIDHHIADSKHLSVSADVLVNWRLSGDQEMCTAGSLALLMFYLEEHYGLTLIRNLLPLAAIGTVADVSPVVGVNRSLVRNGLMKAGFANLPGFRALLDKCELAEGEVSQSDVQFRLAPRINAPGRVDHPILAFNLLTALEYTDALYKVEELETHNNIRKQLCKDITAEAIEQAKALLPFRGIVVANPNWHIGVVGIVASRLVETFNCPALVFGGHNDKIKGSGRSIKGINIKHVLDQCGDLFEVYGGHEMAVGATLKSESLTKIQGVFSELCSKADGESTVPAFTALYDAELYPNNITTEQAESLKAAFYPYCQTHNPEPVFKVSNVIVTSVRFTQPPKQGWRRTTIEAAKDGVAIPMPFTTFDEDIPLDIKDKIVDLYFTFSQMPLTKYGNQLGLVDVIVHEK